MTSLAQEREIVLARLRQSRAAIDYARHPHPARRRRLDRANCDLKRLTDALMKEAA